MSGTIQELIETIEDLMAENDNQVANAMADDAIALQAKYWEFKRNGGISNLQKEYPNHSRFYEKLFAMFGGKTMYNLISEYSATDVRAKVIKSHMNTCTARNTRIAAKLEKAGVKLAIIDTPPAVTDTIRRVLAVADLVLAMVQAKAVRRKRLRAA